MRGKCILFMMITLVLMILVWTEPVSASSDITSKDGRFEYELYESGNYINISRYLGEESSVVIPDVLDGYVVRGIVSGLLRNNNTVKTIEIPNTLWYIQDLSFSGASALERIHMENGFSDAFHTEDGILYNGRTLHSYPPGRKDVEFVVPNGVLKLLDNAFFSCSNLEKIIVPAGTGFIMAPFARCQKPIDIIIKDDVYKEGYLNNCIRQMPIGTRLLVANKELAEQYATEIAENYTGDSRYNTNHYIGSSEPAKVEVFEKVEATDLRFTDGSTEKNVVVEYYPYGTAEFTEIGNFHNFSKDIVQTPTNTTESIKWEVVSGKECCGISSPGSVRATAGGKATIKITDSSDHEITLNIAILSPLTEFSLDNNIIELTVGNTKNMNGTLNTSYSWAFTQGVSWKVDDKSVAEIAENGKRAISNDGRVWCTLRGLEAGITTLHGVVSDNGELVEKTASVKVKDTIENTTVDEIPAQNFTGKSITPDVVVKYKGRILKKDNDYIVTCYRNVCKTGTVLIKGNGLFFGEKEVNFDIISSMDNCKIEYISPQNKTDIKAGIFPKITVTCGNVHLTDGVDYKTEFSIVSNTMCAVKVIGIDKFFGTQTAYFELFTNPQDCIKLTKSMVSIGKEEYPIFKKLIKNNEKTEPIYTTGNDIVNALSVNCNGEKLVLGTDYRALVCYNGLKLDLLSKESFSAGPHDVIVEGITSAGYTGSVSIRINILNNYQQVLAACDGEDSEADPCNEKIKTPKIKKIKSRGKKSFLVKWNKVPGASGYKIQYATNKKFTKNKKTITIKKNTTSKTIKKLKSSKKYYVRIKAYKIVDGYKCYSKWSKTKTRKTR